MTETKQPRDTRRRRRGIILATLVVGAVTLTLLAGQMRFFQLLHLKARDAHFLVRGALPSEEIVLITIDEKALFTFPELLAFWHPYYAEAIHAAAGAGAKVMGLDVTFAVPVAQYEPDHDQLMAEAVISTSGQMPVICGFVPSMMQKQEEWVVPVNLAAAALGQFGFVNLTVDEDDFVRSQELLDAPDEAGDSTRSLAMRVAEKFAGEEAQWENGRLMWRGRAIPTDTDRRISINFAGGPNTFARVSLADFLEAARAGRQDQLEAWVKDKAILMGPDYIDDRHATPFYTFFTTGGENKYVNTAGVEIHASTVRTLLRQEFLVPWPLAVRLLGLTAVASFTVAIVTLLSFKAAAWILLAGIFLTAGLTHVLFRYGILVSTSELLLGCLVAVIATAVYRFLTAEKKRDFFQKAIAVFVGKELARSLAETETIALTGQRMDVTILFSDIRGFTSFCESKDPSVVVELLNDYLSRMVDCIVAEKGHVNKFLGDGILAIFSDIDGTEPGDHPQRAFECGLRMVRETPAPFRTGVGIHTGPAIVGNVGSKDKMEYTVLGDTVNLASRLESMNKETKTSMLLSEATKDRLGDAVDLEHLGSVPVRGKTLPLNIYTPVALRTPAPVGQAASEKQ
ncbi:MAG: CHASE2 domain-containing protein [Bryobacterales bacterium]|nr:CHASE2 domain-containing protein [Bryobacterales bacterium]